MKPFVYLIPLLLLSLTLKVWGADLPWSVQITTDSYGKDVLVHHRYAVRHVEGRQDVYRECGDDEDACLDEAQSLNEGFLKRTEVLIHEQKFIFTPTGPHPHIKLAPE